MNDVVLQATMRGFFKLTATSVRTGRQRLLADWFPNLVTDVGLNRIGTGSYLTACHVGTNNTAPSVLNTALAGYRAGTTTRQSDTYGAQAAPPYYGYKTITYRFAEGAASGNLSEVGIATAAANGGGTILFSRALILDEFGAPTTVTVLSDEVLDVTYQLRLYPPLTDTTSSITITGSGTHTFVARASSVTSAFFWGYFLGNGASMSPRGNNPLAVYNGAIGAITGTPSGASAGSGMGQFAYSNNSLLVQAQGGFGLNYGNLAGGIKSACFETSLGQYQVEFSPNIMKDSIKTLTLIFQLSWDRH